MRRMIVCTVSVLVCVTASAYANPIFLASYGDEIYRCTDTWSESFDVGDDIYAMHTDLDTNEVFALGRPFAATEMTVYKVQNPASGTLSLTPYSSTSQHYGSVTKIGGLFYGFNSGNLYSIDLSDPLNPVESLIGDSGISNNGGSAYDPTTDTFYMVSPDDDTLYEVDYTTAAATPVGALGVDLSNLGMEWWENQLYIVMRNLTSSGYELGTLDTDTGAYTYDFTIRPGFSNAPSALAVIPEPASLSLFVCVLMLSIYRRRG